MLKLIFKLILLVLIPYCAIGKDAKTYDLPVTDRLVHQNLYTITVDNRKTKDYKKISNVWKKRAADLCNNRPYKVFLISEGTLEHEPVKRPPLGIYHEGVFVEFSMPFMESTYTSEHISAFTVCAPDGLQKENYSACYMENTKAEYVSDFYYESAKEYYEIGQNLAALNCIERSISMTHPNSKYTAEAAYMGGEMYENGIGVEVSKEKALTLYRRAAALGHFSALEKISSLTNAN